MTEKFYTHPPLLPGEQIISQQDHVTCVDTFDDVAEGILHITTYRVIFAGCHVQVYHPIQQKILYVVCLLYCKLGDVIVMGYTV